MKKTCLPHSEMNEDKFLTAYFSRTEKKKKTMLQHLCTCCISRLPSCKEGYVHVLEQSLKYISQFSSFSNVYGYSNSLF